jgi:hypothetical protein
MNYATYSLSELKALAIEHNAIPAGDKRSKQTWIDALQLVEAEIDLEHEECTEVAEFLRENPDAEGGYFGEHCSYRTINESDIWADESPLTQTVESAPEPLESAAVVEKVLNYKSSPANKKGAATLVIALLCTLFLAIQSTYEISIAIKKISIQIIDYGKIVTRQAGCFLHKSRQRIRYASA